MIFPFPEKVEIKVAVDDEHTLTIKATDEDRNGNPEFWVAYQGPLITIPSTKIEIPLTILAAAPLSAICGFAMTELTRRGLLRR